MNNFKLILKNILFIAYGFFSGYFTPCLLDTAFNFTKGICNNPEGAIFVPFGIVALLAILTIDILIIVKTIKSKNMTTPQKVITVSLFVVAKIVGLMQDQNGWKNFVDCFKWKFL